MEAEFCIRRTKLGSRRCCLIYISVADSSHEHAHQHINGCRGIRSLNWIPKDLVTSRGEYEVYDGENIFGHMAVCGTSHPYQLYSWLDFNPNIVTALNTDMKD
ncbi:uncharacterized protein LOC120260547 isoform X2 [Dioscorea cayenensis subsp. rotundata]|uniref:Uncharacterized protein LOC120260547 isoform X2 n=1 Tax=Dioscorea cayennensis subsp. rotundata TaxID=55577 RepID=A0AB40B9R8_DIOCR|nr:uncharacterized protein LOC120260547 isoform X2 [Dioscorea cayenensis subsp. rotundata]